MTIISDKKKLFLKINLGYVCNYRCSYCFQKHDNFDQEEQIKYVTNNLSKLKDILPKALSNLKEKRYVEIVFIGGEPTLYNISSLMSEITKNNKHFLRLRITTNLSNYSTIIREMINFKKILKIDASYHPEMVKFDVFKKRIKELVDNGFNIRASLVLNEDTEKYVDDFLTLNEICNASLSTARDKNNLYSNTSFLKDKSKALSYMRVYDKGEKYFFSREEFIEKYGDNGRIDFFGKYCFGALELNMINNTFFTRCTKERKKINYKDLSESLENFNFQICPRHECELCYISAVTDSLDELKEAYSVLYKRN